MRLAFSFFLTVLILLASGCNPGGGASAGTGGPEDAERGTLFIIGGGSRPQAMIRRMIKEAGLREGGYGVILPMAGFNPDTSIYYARRQFVENGIEAVYGLQVSESSPPSPALLDSIRNAKLVYLSGGDQNRFMDTIEGTGIEEVIIDSYQRGHVIAGTSAGAAVMSKKMITGNERKHSEYHSTFRSLEADNIEIREGLGLLTDVIIDQHFITRSRYNRLLTAVMEFPDVVGVGLDESTAIIVESGRAEVVGKSQVVVIRNASGSSKEQDGLLGTKNMRLDVYLPGETFALPGGAV